MTCKQKETNKQLIENKLQTLNKIKFGDNGVLTKFLVYEVLKSWQVPCTPTGYNLKFCKRNQSLKIYNHKDKTVELQSSF